MTDYSPQRAGHCEPEWLLGSERAGGTVKVPGGALPALSRAANDLDVLGDARLSSLPWEAMLSVAITDRELRCVSSSFRTRV